MVCATCLVSMTDRSLQRDCPAGGLTIGGLHQNTVQRQAYESAADGSILGRRWAGSS
jgi:hypothetical protein